MAYYIEVGPHDLKALVRSTESLAFLVRDTAHVTPANFEICVDAIRAFVEASINGVNKRPSLADQRKKKKSRRSKNADPEVEIDTESNTEEYHKGLSIYLQGGYKTLRRFCARSYNQPPCTY